MRKVVFKISNNIEDVEDVEFNIPECQLNGDILLILLLYYIDVDTLKNTFYINKQIWDICQKATFWTQKAKTLCIHTEKFNVKLSNSKEFSNFCFHYKKAQKTCAKAMKNAVNQTTYFTCKVTKKGSEWIPIELKSKKSQKWNIEIIPQLHTITARDLPTGLLKDLDDDTTFAHFYNIENNEIISFMAALSFKKMKFKKTIFNNEYDWYSSDPDCKD